MSLSEQETTGEQHSINPQHEEGAAAQTDSHHETGRAPASEEGGSLEGHTDEEKEGHTEKQSAHKKQFDQFLADLEKRTDLESKLQFAIDFMEASLAQGGTPHFKSFWEARNICLQLFKENIAPALRSILWAKYNDLSKEARRLKEILDEQSAFAVEQIEIAVKALEEDITAHEDHLEKMARVEFSDPSSALRRNLSSYEKMQRELNLLNAQASRINAMRKELIRTEMRVRQKNKFFQRLSSAGDKVFPKRKDLIKEVSQLFSHDVEEFIKVHFAKEDLSDSLFALREEIKALQNMAKVLTLNTHAFTHTRKSLSECWDRIKSEDKERKKERTIQKAAHKENFDAALAKIEAFNQSYQETQPSPEEATKQLDALVNEIRGMEHGRDELRLLREKVQEVRKIISDKLHAKELERTAHEQEKEKQRRQKIHDAKHQAERLVKEAAGLDADAIESKRDEIIELLQSLQGVNKTEKTEIERVLKPLRDIISEKRESSLLSLSDDDKESLQQLKEVLSQRRERRQEIKAQIDQLRKSAGMSGLDFEQAMNFNAQVASEKERLEKINLGIQEIEQKIAKLSKR